MATTLTAIVNSQVQAKFTSTGGLSATFTGNPAVNYQKAFNSTEITKIYIATATVTTTPTSIDLTAVTDAFGNSISFSSVKQLIIHNKDTAIALTVGGGTNGLFSTLPFTLVGYDASQGSDGTCLNLTTTISIDGTHKILTLTAASGSISVDIIVLGS